MFFPTKDRSFLPSGIINPSVLAGHGIRLVIVTRYMCCDNGSTGDRLHAN